MMHVKMMYMVFYFLISCRYTLSLRFGIFSKTNVITNNCDETQLIKTTNSPYLKHCAFSCSADKKCRRFLYCSDNKSCKLYEDGTNCIQQSQIGCSCYQKTIGCDEDNNCTCPLGYYGENCQNIITDCTDGYVRKIDSEREMLTTIKPLSATKPFETLCYLGHGGYTSILTRSTYCEYEDFNRTLEEYESGFGEVYLNSWIGFTNILHILNNPPTFFTLEVQMVPKNAKGCSSYYQNFQIGNKSSNYVLSLSKQEDWSYNCGDSLRGNLDLQGRPFSTYDVDFTGENDCGLIYGGGWWFSATPQCTESFLTGSTKREDGVYLFWKDDLAGKDFDRVSMKLKRGNF